MKTKNTQELEIYVNELYEKLKPLAEQMGVYKLLNIQFEKLLPGQYVGAFCYTNKNNKYVHGNVDERGNITYHIATSSLFDICYSLLKNEVFWMATIYESMNRIPNQDSRRLSFEKRINLFNELGGNYRKRVEIDIDETLKEFPYNDIK